MTEERVNGRRAAIVLALSASLVLVGAWTPWVDVLVDGRPVDAETALGLRPFRITTTVAGAGLAAVALAVALLRRPFAALLARASLAIVAVAAVLMALGPWMLIDAGTSLPGVAATATSDLRPGWGLVVLSVGAALGVAGAFVPARRTWEQTTRPLVTRPFDAQPVRADELVPGWYSVDGRRRWWDGRAWA